MKSTIAILLEIFLHFTQTHWDFERLLNRYYELNKNILDRERKSGRFITDDIYSIGNIEYFNVVTQNDDISS